MRLSLRRPTPLSRNLNTASNRSSQTLTSDTTNLVLLIEIYQRYGSVKVARIRTNNRKLERIESLERVESLETMERLGGRNALVEKRIGDLSWLVPFETTRIKDSAREEYVSWKASFHDNSSLGVVERDTRTTFTRASSSSDHLDLTSFRHSSPGRDFSLSLFPNDITLTEFHG